MPLLDLFSHRKLCSLDPTEVCFWMQRIEMGQSAHHEFWTIGLNMYGDDSKVPKTPIKWKTYFPLVDTSIFQIPARPKNDRFTTVGQWYWDGQIEWNGEWKDFSKRAAFEQFLSLPHLIPGVQFELAMNLNPDDPEKTRLRTLGWRHKSPHAVARTPSLYYNYIGHSTAEFSAVKLESHMMSGWLSDRSAIYLAQGRPVISEPTGAEKYLPPNNGMFFAKNIEEAVESVRRICIDWKKHSQEARTCAAECFDAVVNLKKILGR